MQNIALITGTGGGLGLSLAKLLIKKNWLVYGFSRTNKIYHENFNFKKIDLSDNQKVSRLSLPKIDSNYNVFLINNAATIGEIVPLKKRKEKCILDSYNLNIITPTILCKKFLISYEKNFKTIINISSGAAIKNISSWSTYCASKSAIDMLSKVLHEENYKNLRVYSLYPGIIDTKMQYKIRTSSKKDFPLVDSFKDYYMNGELESAENVAKKVFHVMEYPKKYKEIVFSTRDVGLN